MSSTSPYSVAPHTAGFQFKQFFIAQDRCAMRVGTDGVLLGAWVETEAAQSILDIGTGTGVIAIMLAQRNEHARVHGVEIDGESAAQAAENMLATPWADRLESRHYAIQDYARDTEQRYDLIVSNPPFFTGGVLSQSENKTGVRHTVKLPHGDLLRATQTLLTTQGVFAVVLPLIEGLRFVEMARSYRLYCERMTEVRTKAGKPVSRLLLQFTRHIPDIIRKDELIIQEDEANSWTGAYRELTSGFYL